MSFNVHYSLDKRPKQIFTDGREEYPEDARRWSLFQQAQQASSKKRAQQADAALLAEAEEEHPVEERTPQKVVDQLTQARGELDVILDLINSVEQQQFISLAHVPQPKDPAAVAKQASLKLARRQAQLQATAERLRSGTEAARCQAAVVDRFLEDLAEIRKEWKLSRRSANMGAIFDVDISLPLPSHTNSSINKDAASSSLRSQLQSSTTAMLAIPWADLQRFEDTHINIVPSAEGVACMVVSAPLIGATIGKADASLLVIKGPIAISAELRRRQLLHSWKVIGKILAAEAQHTAVTTMASDDGAGAAVQGMAAAALKVAEKQLLSDKYLAKEQGAFEEGVYNVADQSGGGLESQDLARYCSAPSCQLQFEGRALQCLAALCKDARIPALIKDTRAIKLNKTTLNAATGPDSSMLSQLTSWLRHAALCHAVDTFLTQQQTRIQTIHREISIEVTPNAPNLCTSEGARAWGVSIDSRPFGTLLVEHSQLRWEGEPIPGHIGGSQLGRRELDTLLDNLTAPLLSFL